MVYQSSPPEVTIPPVHSQPYPPCLTNKPRSSAQEPGHSGCELPEPRINGDVLEKNFTNEVGVCNTIRFLKNLNGLWIIQSFNGYGNSKT